MRGLAGLDRVLDCRQRPWRKNPPRPPAVLEKMPADAPDAHATSSYQLPDAPPPPKLPPPPPLSLELLELELLPEYDPPLPDQPLLPRPDVVASPNNVTRKATMPASTGAIQMLTTNQAMSAASPAIKTAATSRPRVTRSMPP